MQNIIVNTPSYVRRESIGYALKTWGDFRVCTEQDPKQVVEQCRTFAANMVLMEVVRHSPWTYEERMKIRDEILRNDPSVKIVLLVDEKSEKQTAEQIKQAKRDGLIDQFIYGSTSSSYMVALLDTMA